MCRGNTHLSFLLMALGSLPCCLAVIAAFSHVIIWLVTVILLDCNLQEGRDSQSHSQLCPQHATQHLEMPSGSWCPGTCLHNCVYGHLMSLADVCPTSLSHIPPAPTPISFRKDNYLSRDPSGSPGIRLWPPSARSVRLARSQPV